MDDVPALAQIKDQSRLNLALLQFSNCLIDLVEGTRLANHTGSTVGVKFEGFREVDPGPYQ